MKANDPNVGVLPAEVPLPAPVNEVRIGIAE